MGQERVIDLNGRRFGYLTGLRRDPAPGYPRWICRCDCGVVKSINSGALRQGRIRSCGCYNMKRRRDRRKHGALVDKKKTPEYATWRGMITRCENPNDKRYASYGGRGITVCARWREDFASFLEDMGEKPKGLTIERLDVNGHYEPSNCIWASKKAQARNKTTTLWVEYRGQRKSLTDWVEAAGVPYGRLYARLRRGLTAEQALADCHV